MFIDGSYDEEKYGSHVVRVPRRYDIKVGAFGLFFSFIVSEGACLTMGPSQWLGMLLIAGCHSSLVD